MWIHFYSYLLSASLSSSCYTPTSEHFPVQIFLVRSQYFFWQNTRTKQFVCIALVLNCSPSVFYSLICAHFCSESTKEILLSSAFLHLEKKFGKSLPEIRSLNQRILLSGPSGSFCICLFYYLIVKN